MAVRARVWVGYAGLCLLSGSGWILDEWQPPVLPGLLALAVHSGILAGVFWVLGRSSRSGLQRPGLWRIAGWAGLLVGVPPVALAGTDGAVSTLTGVLVFAVVPVFVILVGAVRADEFGTSKSPLDAMGPALLGLAGAALVLPFSLPVTEPGFVWLGVLVAVAAASGWSAVRLHGVLEGVGCFTGAAVFAGISCVTAAMFCWMTWAPVSWSGLGLAGEVVRLLGIDGPVVLLTVWLLREMQPVGFSSRMLLVPLVTIVEGYALVRPRTSWSLVAGMLMLAVGSAMLLRADSGEAKAGA